MGRMRRGEESEGKSVLVEHCYFLLCVGYSVALAGIERGLILLSCLSVLCLFVFPSKYCSFYHCSLMLKHNSLESSLREFMRMAPRILNTVLIEEK